MKAKLILFLFCLCTLSSWGQQVVTRPVKNSPQKTEGKTTSTQKDTPQKQTVKPTTEASAYDVTFSCNVPLATMYIDGTNYGNPSGTRMLKTGNHTIKLTAEGYEPYTGSFSVGKSSTKFSFTMNKPPKSDKELYNEALTLFKQEDYKGAVDIFKELAEKGMPEAQYYYAYCQDHKVFKLRQDEVLIWYEKAAEQGIVEAQNELGHHLDYKDKEAAAKWYRMAADAGHADSQFQLGILFELSGLNGDNFEYIKWYKKAAAQGHYGAQLRLAYCYKEGRGVSKDDAEAVSLFKKAAEQGSYTAQYYLAECYEFGRGVPKDHNEAVKWHIKAAKQNYSASIARLKQWNVNY